MSINRERRYRTVYLPPDALLNCLVLAAAAPADCPVRFSLEGVPPGTIPVHRSYDPARQCEVVTLWNAAWPEVPLGELPPEVLCRWARTSINESAPESRPDAPACVDTVRVKLPPSDVVPKFSVGGAVTGRFREALAKINESAPASRPLAPINRCADAPACGHVACTEPHPGDAVPEIHESAPASSPFERTWREKEPLL